ncbi:MAG: hypothetical protein PWQ20_899 [Thermotogaceae bacterium]|jgi:Uri superfamily endonuclease|nr:hypothetical protein [Thermotogaceae bacterium]MDN5337829.1 hypothetical protein [Thermotogaceae bacterium]
MNRGSYVLIIKLNNESTLKYGNNSRKFKEGYYLYVGSAMNSLSGRVKYHLSSEKRGRWHIDKLLKIATLEYVLMIPYVKKIEEKISNRFLREKSLEVIEKFGSSDTKTIGNLFFVKDRNFFAKIFEIIEEVKRYDSIHE